MDYLRLRDDVKERMANNRPQPSCQVSKQAMEEKGKLPSSVQNVEELVNYGEDEENIEDNVPEGGKGLLATVVLEDRSDPHMAESDQVQPCDPYGFN